MVGPRRARTLVSWVREAYSLSERRSCRAVRAARSAVRYERVRPRHQALRKRMKELAAVRVRAGYRQLGVEMDFSRPGKPTDNAFIEAFNGTFRRECLSQHWFVSLDDVRETLSLWKDDYNQTRPHSAWGGLAPESGSRQRRINQG